MVRSPHVTRRNDQRPISSSGKAWEGRVVRQLAVTFTLILAATLPPAVSRAGGRGRHELGKDHPVLRRCKRIGHGAAVLPRRRQPGQLRRRRLLCSGARRQRRQRSVPQGRSRRASCEQEGEILDQRLHEGEVVGKTRPQIYDVYIAS